MQASVHSFLIRLVFVATLLLSALWGAELVSAEQAPTKATIADIQRLLAELGYGPGPADGVMGKRTRTAIKRFQHDTGLPPDGKPSVALRERLEAELDPAARLKRALAAAGPPEEQKGWETVQAGTVRLSTPLRSEPQASAATLQTLATGAPLEVYDRRGAWYQVRANGQEGWVRFTMVRLRSSDAASASAGTQFDNVTTQESEATRQSSGFFSNFSRGVTGIFGSSNANTPSTSGTSTIGIRGLNSSMLAGARPNPGELKKLERFAAGDAEAIRFAEEIALTRHDVAYLPKRKRTQAQQASTPTRSKNDDK